MKIYCKLKTSLYPILSVHLILTFVMLLIYTKLYQVQLLLKLCKIVCYQLKMQEKLKESFEKRITENSNVEFLSLIKKYPLKNLEYCSLKIIVQNGDKEKQIVVERYIWDVDVNFI